MVAKDLPLETPYVGRDELHARVRERLLRPDDVRESPKQFIYPGFYGVGGVGKSRLLAEIARQARELTPYVVQIDFDPSRSLLVPGTPVALVQAIINQLREVELSLRPRWKFWQRESPFAECERILGQLGSTPISQTIQASGGATVTGVNMTMQVGDAGVPPNLAQALQASLARLSHRVEVRREWGDTGAKPRPRPIIVTVLDTVELAPGPLRSWLPQNLGVTLGVGATGYHVVVAGAGRVKTLGLLETHVAALNPKVAAELLRAYAGRARRARSWIPP